MHSHYQNTAEKTASSLFSKHHVGGRNGRSGFPDLGLLNGSLASTMYDADESCCAQIESELLSAGYAKARVIAQCIGTSCSEVMFNLNYDPYTSSVLKLNPKYSDYYADMGRFDYAYGDAIATVKQIPMQTVSMDDIQDKLPVDFLSLDTQGSELDILKGSQVSLKNAVGVETEVSFRLDLRGDAAVRRAIRISK